MQDVCTLFFLASVFPHVLRGIYIFSSPNFDTFKQPIPYLLIYKYFDTFSLPSFSLIFFQAQIGSGPFAECESENPDQFVILLLFFF